MSLRKIALALSACVLFLAFNATYAETADPAHQFGDGEIRAIQWQAGADEDPTLLVATDAGAFFFTPELKLKHQMPDVRLASFSPDGRFLAGVYADDLKTPRIWETSGYTQTTTLTVGASFDSPLTILSWSTDGRYLATHRMLGESCVFRVEDWDFPSCNRGSSADELVWSPDNTYFATVDHEKGSVVVFNPEHLSAVFWHRPQYFSQFTIDVVWQTDRELLRIEWNETPLVLLWDVVTGQELEPPIAAYDYIYSPQRDKLVTTGPYWSVRVSDVSTDEPLFTVLVRDEHFGTQSVGWSTDGNCLAVGTYDHSWLKNAGLYLVNSASGKVQTKLDDAFQKIASLAWSPDNRYIAVVDGRQQLFVYQVEEGCQASREPVGFNQQFSYNDNTVVWSDDSTQIAISDMLGGITLYDTETGDKAQVLSPERDELPVAEMQWQPGGALLAAQHRDWLDVTPPTLEFWDMAIAQLRTDDLHLPPDTSVILFDWSHDGQKLAWQTDKGISIWDITSAQITYLESLRGGAKQLWWSLSDKYLGLFPQYSVTQGYAYDFDGMVMHANNIGTEEGDFRWTLNDQGEDELIRWAWKGGVHAYGGFIVPSLIRYSSEAFTVEQSSHQFTGLRNPIAEGFLSPNAKYGAGITEDELGLVWNLETGDPVMMLSDTKGIVWSPDERRLIIQRADGSLWLMTSQGQFLAELLSPDGRFADTDEVLWSPDSQQIAFRRAGVLTLWKLRDVLRP